MRSDVVRGHLDVMLLAVLEDAPRHGYAIIDALREKSAEVFDLPEGTVYPALHRLERAGLLESEWHDVGGRRRRRYKLTTSGTRALGERRAEWAHFSNAVQNVLGKPTKGRAWPSPA